MSGDVTFAELIAAHRAYRTALAELLGLARRIVVPPEARPGDLEVLRRAEAALERFQ